MIVEDLEIVSDELGPMRDLGLAPPGQLRARIPPVADIAVGHGHELDMIPLGHPKGRGSGGAGFGVVRVGADAQDPRLPVIGRRRTAQGPMGSGDQNHRDKGESQASSGGH